MIREEKRGQEMSREEEKRGHEMIREEKREQEMSREEEKRTRDG